mgnify:CR=1 FL=1
MGRGGGICRFAPKIVAASARFAMSAPRRLPAIPHSRIVGIPALLPFLALDLLASRAQR